MCHPTAYVCVYYNDQICNTNEGTTFVSNNTKTFMVDKVITFTQLLELVHQKLNIEPHQHIQYFHFRCPIFEPGQPYMYTCFILGDDPDVRQMFNIFYSNPTDAILPRRGPITRAMARRFQVDWARDAGQGPRVLVSLRKDFGPMG